LVIAGYSGSSSTAGRTALLIGFSFALSSTAFVVQMLRDQGEIASRHGQTAFAVLLMQDLAVVPLLALVPILADADRCPRTCPCGSRSAGSDRWSPW
jgi:glutathione-regulated potassium-efflux system ancillary protein KefC